MSHCMPAASQSLTNQQLLRQLKSYEFVTNLQASVQHIADTQRDDKQLHNTLYNNKQWLLHPQCHEIFTSIPRDPDVSRTRVKWLMESCCECWDWL